MNSKSAREVIEEIARENIEELKSEKLRNSINLNLGIWGDPTHIFAELIQNADDAGAEKGELIFKEDGIIFGHNGKLFSEEDVRKLSSIGETTKKGGQYIGFMGVGFKSVFGITDKPHIFSGKFRFYYLRKEEINKKFGTSVIVPHYVEEIPKEIEGWFRNNWTIFYFPFKEDILSNLEEEIKKSLFNFLEPVCLIFLRNLREIKFKIGNEQKIFIRENVTENKELVIKEINGNEEILYNYLKYEKRIIISEKAKKDSYAKDSGKAELEDISLMIVFDLDKDKNISFKENVLYTFLPTKFETKLRFTINSNFILDTSRGNIVWSSLWNLWLFEEVVNFLKEIIEDFKNSVYCYEFYNILPRKSEINDKLLKYMYKPIIEYCQNTPIVLTSEKKFAKPSEVVFCEEEIQKLMPPEILGFQNYVNSKIKEKDFLESDLNIKKVVDKDAILIAFENEDWVKKQSTRWFIKIYEYLYEKLYTENSWKCDYWELKKTQEMFAEKTPVRLIDKTITKDKDILLPPDEDKEFRMLSGLPKIFKFVDKKVLTESTKKLLVRFGVKNFSEKSVVEKIIGEFNSESWKNWDEKRKINAIEYVKNYVKSSNWKYVDGIENLKIPTCKGWVNANECYFLTRDLKELIPNGNYVKLSFSKEKEWEKFFKLCGVLDYPRVVKIEGEFGSWNNIPKSIPEEHWKEYGRYVNFNIQNKEVFTMDIFYETYKMKGKNKILLKFILNNWSYYKDYIQGKYHYFYRTERIKYVDSFFAFQLKQTEWLPTNRGIKRPSSEIFLPTKEVKNIAGNLVAYLDVDEEQIKNGKEFFNFLGIRDSLNLNNLVYLLEKAKEREVNEKLKKQLEKIYSEIYEKIKDTTEEIKVIYLLGKDDKFYNSEELYWNDYNDIEIENLFSEVKFIWIPKSLSTPQLESLFEKLKVKRVSENIQRILLNPDKFRIDNSFKKWLKGRSNLVRDILIHCGVDKQIVNRFFNSFEVYRRNDGIEIELELNGEKCRHFQSCFIDLGSNKMFISKSDYRSISFEIIRVFNVSKIEYAKFIEEVLTKDNLKEVKEDLERYGINVLELPKDFKDYEKGTGKTKGTKEAEGKGEAEKIQTENIEEVKITSIKKIIKLQEYPKVSIFPTIKPPENSGIRESKKGTGEKKTASPTFEEVNKRREKGKYAQQVVIEFEKQQGRIPKDVSEEYLGYDIESEDNNREKRYIEVKTTEISLTENEYKVAQEHKEKYWLYIVDFKEDNNCLIRTIQCPTNCKIKEDVISQTIYKILNWEEKAETFSITFEPVR